MLQQISITGLNHEGDGVGRTEEGKVVFIPFALPREKISCNLTLEKKRWCKGELQEILSPSPHRIEPLCATYYQCGGCSLQHLEYKEQVKWKRGKVRQNLSRLGGLQQLEVLPLLSADNIFGYRNKLTLHYAQIKEKENALGFFSPGTRSLVPVDNCLLASSLMNDAIKLLSKILQDLPPKKIKKTMNKEIVLRQSFSRQELLLLFRYFREDSEKLEKISHLLKEKQPALTSAWQELPGKNERPACKPLAGKEKLFEELLGKNFYLGPSTFFQVNKAQAQVLYQKVLELLEPVSPAGTLVDIHCGAGLMTLLTASMAQKVIGIESFPPAVEDARYNAQINNISNATFLEGAAEKHLPQLLKKKKEIPDLALLNPPRVGCSPSLLRTINNSKIPHLIYVSCDPATLARDLRILINGGYRPGPVQPLDMFPQTSHVESIVALEK